jgi:N4-gp56 family major capsid protein
MAMTNFGKLTNEQATVWARDVWREARQQSFFMSNFVGDGMNAMISRVKELKQVKGAARAVITLVPDLEGDGVVGDNQLEGNEEEIKAYDQVIEYDQLRNANRLEGRMADMRSIIQFRENSKNLLSYWLAQRIDELVALTMSGVSYAYKPNGALRVGSQFPQLAFASYVTPPSANRHFRWDVDTVNSLQPGNTANVAATDVPTWDMLVDIKAKAVELNIRPIRGEGGYEMFNVFMSAAGIAKLKKDPNFINAWTHAQKAGNDNPLFKGTRQGGRNGFLIDGLNILEYHNVYTTTGAPSGSKWGGGTVDGQRVIVAGAQALGVADIGLPRWVEKDFDYDNSPGVSIAKLFGLLKPVWRSSLTGTNEDFGLFVVDTAI